MGPLAPDHPLVTHVQFGCDVCLQPFRTGEYVTLVPVKPASEDDARKKEQGRPYNYEAAPIHWECRDPE